MVLYAVELQHLDIDILEGVIENCIKNCKVFPTIAELRADYRTAHQRHVDATRKPMLVAGASPVPEALRPEWEEMKRRFANRSKELDGEEVNTP